MRPSGGFSARAVVLAAVFCVLSVAPGCGRETFDLLATGGASGQPSLPQAGASAGGGGADSGGNAGREDGGKGGGLGGSAGSSGRPSMAGGGNGGGGPCLAGSACMDGGLGCPATVPLCTACVSNKECPGDALHCDPNTGRCIECQRAQDCSNGEGCNVLTKRCAPACKDQGDCAGDSNRPLCHKDMGVCVSCSFNSDCVLDGHSEYRCYLGTCVECFENWQCQSNACVAGHCDKMH